MNLPSLSSTTVASVASEGSPIPAELQQRTRKQQDLPSDKSKTAKRGDFTGISVFTLCQSSVPATHCSQTQKPCLEQKYLRAEHVTQQGFLPGPPNSCLLWRTGKHILLWDFPQTSVFQSLFMYLPDAHLLQKTYIKVYWF